MVDIALVLQDCGLRRSEAVALVWSDIGRWDDGSGRLLIDGSTADQTGVGEVVFITRRSMAALDQIQQLHGNASPAVFGTTAKTINPPGRGGGFGRAVLRQLRPVVQQRWGNEVHPGRVTGPRRPVAGMRWLE